MFAVIESSMLGGGTWWLWIRRRGGKGESGMVLRILFQFFPTFDSCTLIYFPILVFDLYSLPLCTFAPFPLYPHSLSVITLSFFYIFTP
jgi:hypothetical protein